ncbi:MAG: tetratricopeptide repeat protein [Fimbriimonadales bacterium]|nr:tetratricopeptide repeat protein [Fimbriimonadales bacterium]MDW8052429.1 tetratricopeptide repeat protein [Armatimonadota bacterium]
MTTNGATDTRAQLERLMREAMGLYEQGRLEEALLVCEGALAIDERFVPALSLKGLIHERRGQIREAIEAYERVKAINPLSVSERARLEALLHQQRAAVRMSSTRPLWQEAMPAVMAFLGAGLVLLIGLVLVLRWSAPATPPPAQGAATPEPAVAQSAPAPRVPPPAETSPPPAQPQPIVPPVVVDPSRVALAPAEPRSRLRGAIPDLPAPESPPAAAPKTESTPPPKKDASPTPAATPSEVMPDVKVEETERGVYRIVVRRADGASSNRSSAERSANDALSQAQAHQRAGNYREAIQAYLQALPSAPNPAEIHQQIAICYLRLGEKANARTHFQQAIAEYERQIQAGRDVEAARQGIAACQNGLQLCNE